MLFSRSKTQMVAPERALTGRDHYDFPVPDTHHVNGPAIKPPFPEGLVQAVVGLGCFWGAEEIFWQHPGVWSTAVGYTGGVTAHPDYEEVCSGQTGHTEAGGYGLVASGKRGERRVIVVINGLDSMRQRAEEGERLLDWAFANFEDVTLFSAGDVIERVPVWLGTRPSVALVGGRDLVVTMPRNWRKNASVKVSYDTPIRAPVQKGTTLGKLVVAGTRNSRKHSH